MQAIVVFGCWIVAFFLLCNGAPTMGIMLLVGCVLGTVAVFS